MTTIPPGEIRPNSVDFPSVKQLDVELSCIGSKLNDLITHVAGLGACCSDPRLVVLEKLLRSALEDLSEARPVVRDLWLEASARRQS